MLKKKDKIILEFKEINHFILLKGEKMKRFIKKTIKNILEVI